MEYRHVEHWKSCLDPSMRSDKINLLLLLICLPVTACTESTPINLEVVLPDGFRGFGAIYRSERSSTDVIGRFEMTGDAATAFVDRSGGLEAGLLLESLRVRGFRITVFSESGEEMPLRLSSRDPTDGTRFWLLAMPASKAVYFFVGTADEVRAFDTETNEVYETGFSADAYFRSRKGDG